MSLVTFESSLLEFNHRVLAQGSFPITPSGPVTMEDLKDMLFFNRVFLSNMTEMYQKYNMSRFDNDYIEMLNEYAANVMYIINALKRIGDITVESNDSFGMRLATESSIEGILISKTYQNPNVAKGFIFDPDTIYYLSRLENGSFVISYIDKKRSVYSSPIHYDIAGKTVYYKTDYAICNHIRFVVPGVAATVAIRVTSNNKTSVPTKVEFVGDDEKLAMLMMRIFPSDSLIVNNPFIYTDDINQIIEANINKPVVEPEYRSLTINDILHKDQLLEFPKNSFGEYLNLLHQAARSNMTESIKIALYRIGDNPAIYYVLADAASRGIHVHVNIELCASGEDINQFWYREMKAAGIHVTMYACGRLKVHSKLTLIKFKNGRSIAQIGTGNYHSKTTSQYTDLCLLTADHGICSQVENVFQIFDHNDAVDFNSDFLVTRYNAREDLHDLIIREANKGEQGFIALKCNSLDDDMIIDDLEYAAKNGCYIYAVIRGACTWVPSGYPHVIIKSIIWSKLEHSRVYCFGNTNPAIYIGSLDPVEHKIDKRIETLIRVKDPDIVVRVCEYLNNYITNVQEAWIQTPSGLYVKAN